MRVWGFLDDESFRSDKERTKACSFLSFFLYNKLGKCWEIVGKSFPSFENQRKKMRNFSSN